MEKSKKTNLILLCLNLILLITLILSFVKTNSKKNVKPVKTAIVNPKYENIISEFILQKGDDAIYLIKNDDLWFVSSQPQKDSFIPADKQKVQNFIKDLIKIVNLYKISDSYNKIQEFGLDYEQAFCVKYEQNELFFGNYDFSKTNRYLMTGKNTSIYQISTDLDKYLTTSVQAWNDPEIVCKSVLKTSPEDIQRIEIQNFQQKTYKVLKPETSNFIDVADELLKLRHGGCSVTNSIGECELKLILQTGDASEVSFEFYKTASDSEYNVACNYKLELSKKNYNYEVKISLWTYNKIKEITL